MLTDHAKGLGEKHVDQEAVEVKCHDSGRCVVFTISNTLLCIVF